MKVGSILNCAVAITLFAGSLFAEAPSASGPEKLAPTVALKSMEPQILQALQEAAKPYDRQHPDFSSLDYIFSKARVIGVGQQTHGTQEIFKAQIDLIMYLIQKHGVRTILWEDSYGSVAPVNDYVLGKQANIEPLARGLMTPWRTKEVGDLFRWLRKWNQEHPGDHVDVIGIDGQSVLDRTIEDVWAFLPKKDASLWADTYKRIKAVAAALYSPTVSLDEKMATLREAMALSRHLESIACGRTAEEWILPLIAVQSIVSAIQMDIGFSSTDRELVGKTIPAPAPGTSTDIKRDLGMATNIHLLLNARPAMKCAVFAHSLHIAMEPSVGSYFSMGSMLAWSVSNGDYPDDLKAKGTVCAVTFGTRRGTVRAKSQSELLANMKGGPRAEYKSQAIPQIVPYSLEGLLGKVGGGKDLIIDLHQTKGWLSMPLWLFGTGASMATVHEIDPAVDASYNYSSVAPSKAFDAYILLDRTEAATFVDHY